MRPWASMSLTGLLLVLGLSAGLQAAQTGAVTGDHDRDGVLDRLRAAGAFVSWPAGDAPRKAEESLTVLCSMAVDRTHEEDFDISGFTDYLISEGWTVEEILDGPLTGDLLAAYDILLVPTRLGSDPLTPFMPSEVAAIMAFLDDGKGLWVFHDYGKDPSGVNSLAGELGVAFFNDLVTDPTNNENGNPSWPTIYLLQPHAITDGVGSYGYYAGCCLDVASPAEIIATGDDDASSDNCPSFPPVLAVYEDAGRAVFSGDITVLHPNYYPDQLDEEELLLLDNIATWLCVAPDQDEDEDEDGDDAI